MNTTHLLSIFYALILLLLVSTNHTFAQQWEDISQPIFDEIGALDTTQDVLSRGLGTLMFLPQTGELLAVTNGINHLFVSQDQGSTWAKVDEAQLSGRCYGGFSTSYDPETQRYIIFMIARADSLSATSLMYSPEEKSFEHFTEPSHVKHDAWTWGMPDWSGATADVILGKEHHAWVKLWLSTDKGQSWQLLDFESRNPGVINDSIFVAGNDDGMYRSTDQGKHWEKINTWKVTGKNPIKHKGSFYWTTDQGIIASQDQGKTWSLQGELLEGALWGPYFGQDQHHMMVISPEGFFVTEDSGKQWQKVVGYFNIPDSNRQGSYNVTHPTNSYGWDWRNGYIYAAGLGGRAYRFDIKYGSKL